jgi:L-aspartate oxidase
VTAGAADGAAAANPNTSSAARTRTPNGTHAPESVDPDSSERVIGVRTGAREIYANAVILATGGYAALWGRSTNAPETRGAGLALAWSAGAALADLEFVQFHPTALSLPGRPAFLLSEALRGEGARLVDDSGRAVVDPLLPRDIVARALHRQLRHGPVFLTLQHLDPVHVRAQFGQIAARLDEFGLDITHDRLPVAPAAHYCMGGIRTDTWGRTTVAGLYAAGEVACSGVQGANRLASNSLLECLVFGARAAEAALSDPPSAAADFLTQPLPAHLPEPKQAHEPKETTEPQGPHRIVALDATVLGKRLDRDVAVERHGTRLAALITELPEPEASEAAAPDLLLASLIARAALLRTESRGAHFRTDFPNSNAQFRGRIHWCRGQPPAFEEVVSTP